MEKNSPKRFGPLQNLYSFVHTSYICGVCISPYDGCPVVAWGFLPDLRWLKVFSCEICRLSGAFVLHCGDDLFIAGVFFAAVAHIVPELRNSVLLINRCFGTFSCSGDIRSGAWNCVTIEHRGKQPLSTHHLFLGLTIIACHLCTYLDLYFSDWDAGQINPRYLVLNSLVPRPFLDFGTCPTQISSMCFLCQAVGAPGFEATLWSELGTGDRSLGFTSFNGMTWIDFAKGRGCSSVRTWGGSSGIGKAGLVWKQPTLDGKIPNQAFLCCLCIDDRFDFDDVVPF